jgi:hypothetical protein
MRAHPSRVLGALIIMGSLGPVSPLAGQEPLLGALDADRDGTLSGAEIERAASALLVLDADASGDLGAAEWRQATFGICGVRPERAGGARPGPGVMGGCVGGQPTAIALDRNADGALSRVEIDDAAMSLLALDADNSGTLAVGELSWGGAGRLGGPAAGPGRAGRGAFGPPGRGRPGGPPPGPPGRAGGRGRGALGVPPGMAALEPDEIPAEDGAATIPDMETFHQLSYQGIDVLVDTQLRGVEFVKFVITGADGGEPKTYFQNTEVYRGHPMFMQVMGLSAAPGAGVLRGVLVYRPLFGSASGAQGLFTFEFEPNNSFPYETIRIAHDELVEHAPIVKDRLAYHPLPAAVDRYRREREQYEAGGLQVVLDEDLYTDIAYLPMHQAEGYGLLRIMSPGERPGPRDVVLYRTLPNELPRVAGIITAVRQTPLAHVNLRAVQDGVPNAFIRGAAEDPRVVPLVGRNVYYRVAADGFELREASTAEVNAHFAAHRPAAPQSPVRDLSVTQIRPLDQVEFGDARSVGVKAANVAVLRKIGLPAEVVPDGFAIPFHFYDQFMRHNGFYAEARRMLADPRFLEDSGEREEALEDFRDDIEDGAMPDWMTSSLAELQGSFPAGVPIRMRSSTNNEDLPSFSGAGLYDSFTHNPDEGHIAKTVKQVFASLWNLRAFEARDFYRIDHFQAAMGVLVHPNYSNELANGVAVSDDIAYQTQGQDLGRTYYVNVQVGEDLVTNPEGESVPEELLLNSVSPVSDRVLSTSSLARDGQMLLSSEHRDQLRTYLNRIHNRFRELYGVQAGEAFAMDIEFKITAEGRLEVKQARPWVY